jgi:hypothetical protein
MIGLARSTGFTSDSNPKLSNNTEFTFDCSEPVPYPIDDPRLAR